jgi:hypothetical protein
MEPTTTEWIAAFRELKDTPGLTQIVLHREIGPLWRNGREARRMQWPIRTTRPSYTIPSLTSGKVE